MSAARYSEIEKTEIVRRYLAGEDRTALAKAFGCHQSYPDILTKRRFLSGQINPSWQRETARRASQPQGDER